jgi:hypothetical protein
MDKPNDIMEYADMVFLVFDATRRAGFAYEELVTAIHEKLLINRARKWGKPNGTEAIEHIRD